MSEFRPQTGVPFLDTLQFAQPLLSQIEDAGTKRQRAMRTVERTDAKDMLGRYFRVDTLMAYGRRPEAQPGELILYTARMRFVGCLAAFGYMLDSELPVDTLTLHFDDPVLADVAPSEQLLAFSQQQLRVPVLAIDGFVPTL